MGSTTLNLTIRKHFEQGKFKTVLRQGKMMLGLNSAKLFC
jgi:hypothetical protein